MKILGFKNYGSIPHLSNSKLGIGDHYIERGQELILTNKARDKHDTILVFEKYDGSNVGICKVDGKIHAITRSGYEANTSPYKQHHLYADWVKSKEYLFIDLLSNNERIAGEWLLQAHGLKYEIVGDPIVFFDYFNPENERLIFKDLEAKVLEYGLPLPRKLHEGLPITVDELLPTLNKKTDSIKSDELPEGMVYRVERNGKVDFLAKWVRVDFRNGQYCIEVDESNLTWNKIQAR